MPITLDTGRIEVRGIDKDNKSGAWAENGLLYTDVVNLIYGGSIRKDLAEMREELKSVSDVELEKLAAYDIDAISNSYVSTKSNQLLSEDLKNNARENIDAAKAEELENIFENTNLSIKTNGHMQKIFLKNNKIAIYSDKQTLSQSYMYATDFIKCKKNDLFYVLLKDYNYQKESNGQISLTPRYANNSSVFIYIYNQNKEITWEQIEYFRNSSTAINRFYPDDLRQYCQNLIDCAKLNIPEGYYIRFGIYVDSTNGTFNERKESIEIFRWDGQNFGPSMYSQEGVLYSKETINEEYIPKEGGEYYYNQNTEKYELVAETDPPVTGTHTLNVKSTFKTDGFEMMPQKGGSGVIIPAYTQYIFAKPEYTFLTCHVIMSNNETRTGRIDQTNLVRSSRPIRLVPTKAINCGKISKQPMLITLVKNYSEEINEYGTITSMSYDPITFVGDVSNCMSIISKYDHLSVSMSDAQANRSCNKIINPLVNVPWSIPSEADGWIPAIDPVTQDIIRTYNDQEAEGRKWYVQTPYTTKEYNRIHALDEEGNPADESDDGEGQDREQQEAEEQNEAYTYTKDRDNFKTGITYNGVTYASKWDKPVFVGWHITMTTYLNAIADPHSIFYSEESLKAGQHRNAYYGNVCTSFTTLADGWPHPMTNAGMMNSPYVQVKHVADMRMGGIYSNGYGHCIYAVGNESFDETPYSTLIAEQVVPVCKYAKHYPSVAYKADFPAHPSSGWYVIRYDKYCTYKQLRRQSVPYSLSYKLNSDTTGNPTIVINCNAKPYKGHKSTSTSKENNLLINVYPGNLTSRYLCWIRRNEATGETPETLDQLNYGYIEINWNNETYQRINLHTVTEDSNEENPPLKFKKAEGLYYIWCQSSGTTYETAPTTLEEIIGTIDASTGNRVGGRANSSDIAEFEYINLDNFTFNFEIQKINNEYDFTTLKITDGTDNFVIPNNFFWYFSMGVTSKDKRFDEDFFAIKGTHNFGITARCEIDNNYSEYQDKIKIRSQVYNEVWDSEGNSYRKVELPLFSVVFNKGKFGAYLIPFSINGYYVNSADIPDVDDGKGD